MCKRWVICVLLLLFGLAELNTARAQAPSITYPGGAHNYTTGTPISQLIPVNVGGAVPAKVYGQTVTIAGDGNAGNKDGFGTAASISSPIGIVIDPAKNLYFTNWKPNGIPYIYNFIKKMTPAGLVTTFAGQGPQGLVNGAALSSRFNVPYGVAMDGSGNIFVADATNNVIRKITPDGMVSTFVGTGTRGNTDGDNTVATFNAPAAIAIDNNGTLYVADYSNNQIRRITAGGQVTTLAGSGSTGLSDGPGTLATFSGPSGVAVDNAGNVYVGDSGNNAIRKITPGGEVSTIAGSGHGGFTDGIKTAAEFYNPKGVAVDLGGNIYVADAANHAIRKVTPAGVVTTIAGNGALGAADGIGAAASFFDPEGVTLDADGNLFVGDKGNNLIRKISVSGYTIDKPLPTGLHFDPTSGIISGTPTAPSSTTTYIITAYNPYGSSSASVIITVTGGLITAVQPPDIKYETPQVYKVNLTITPLAPNNTGGAVPQALYGGTTIFAGSGQPGATDDVGSLASFTTPDGTAVDAAGNVYVADAGNNSIRKISPAGVVTTLVGPGTFNRPAGIGVDRAGNVYVADAGNNVIRKISPGGSVSIIATGLNEPKGLAVDGLGNVYFTDASNTIKKITSAGVMSTFAGSGGAGASNGQGTAASFNNPAGLSIDDAGYLYVADTGNNLIRKITPGGLVSTLAGTGSSGAGDGFGNTATFNAPVGITVDAIGNVYVADSGNHIIRKITSDGFTSTLAGTAGNTGRSNGQGADASFNDPRGIAVDANGNLFIGDRTNNIIRQVSTNGYIISGQLPPGLIFNGKTGVITGTPTVARPATDYIITAYNTGGNSSANVNITVLSPKIVVEPPPNISYVSPQNYIINTPIINLEPANTGGSVPATIYGQVSTFAGSGAIGSTDATGTGASFSTMRNIATDLVGNVYIVDNNLIRKISPSGVVTTLAGSSAAGSSDGQGAAASFNQPSGIAVDGAGTIYVADTKNNTIRKITQAGEVTTVAGAAGTSGLFNGPGNTARFNAPAGIAVDGDGNLYIADKGNNVIRKISLQGTITTLAGSGSAGSVNGFGSSASFNNPVGVTADQDGNIYVADAGNNLIRKILPQGSVTTLAGSGTVGNVDATGVNASFNNPSGVSADVVGNVFVADAGNNIIRKITPGGTVTTLAGDGTAGAVNGALSKASFNNPAAISIDIFGNVYVTDVNNNIIRQIGTTGYIISQNPPPGLTFDGKTGTIKGTPTSLWPKTTYIISGYNTGGGNSTQITIAVSDKAVPPVPPPDISYPLAKKFQVKIAIEPLTPTNKGGPLPSKEFGKTVTLAGNGTAGSTNGTAGGATFNQPFGVATDVNGNIYVVDHLSNLIRKITPAGVVTTFAGSGAVGSVDGTGTAASFNNPTGIAVDVSGNVYVADASNDKIRKITPAGMVTTLASGFSNPVGVAVDAAGNVYVADQSHNSIKKITPGGSVSTLAGTGLSGAQDGEGSSATFNQPQGVAVDPIGNVYVADTKNNSIRKITPAGVVSTLAGSGQAGKADGQGKDASFNNPFGLAIDENGNLYITDTGNELIRKVSPTGLVTTVAGNGTKGSDNGTGKETNFYQPTGIVADGSGNVYVADEFNNMIRQVVVVSNYTIDKQLPPGLDFDVTTGIISGTPTATSNEDVYTVTAYNAGGNDSWPIRFAVDPAPILPQTITFGPLPAKTYGDADLDPAITSDNSTIPVVITSSDTKLATIVNGKIHIIGAGTVTITATQAANEAYSAATPVAHELVIDPAALSIAAADKVKTFGANVPALTFTYTGFVNNDNAAKLVSQPVITTTAVKSSPVGQYPITISSASSPNYSITYIAGVLTVNAVPPTIVIPNAFSPNGDGTNDQWNIKALVNYPDCKVSIFNRYGQQVFQSRGYGNAWDGTFKGGAAPTGTYYYIIDPGTGDPLLSGCVCIIR